MHFTLGEQVIDLAENAVQAGAGRVEILWDHSTTETGAARIRIEIRDDGSGMDAETLARVTDPFYTDGTKHVGRKVGLGLAFMRQTAEAVDGQLAITSEPGHGTTVVIALPADHVDVPPEGSMVETLGFLLCMGGEGVEIEIDRRNDHGSYVVTRSELEEVLDDITTTMGRGLLREFLQSQEDEIWQR